MAGSFLDHFRAVSRGALCSATRAWTSVSACVALVVSCAVSAFAAPASVGGQAVMEGVMMRKGDKLAVAVRTPSGEIVVEVWSWFSLTQAAWLKKPFIRGFPVLLETLVNGIKALNYSAEKAVEGEGDGEELKPWHLALTLVVSIGLALGLFVVAPHLFSVGMKALGYSGGAETVSFHAWDGLFKLAIFLGYILAISLVPDIRRVFEYHGAEHKTIWAYETDGEVDPARALVFSRLHPRCGTTFLLLVLSISILLHTVLVPLVLLIHSPESSVAKHAFIVLVKLFLMVPISCLAYEAVKYTGKYADNAVCKAVGFPGLMLQKLTTKEPDADQMEVAAAALRGALGPLADKGDAPEVI